MRLAKFPLLPLLALCLLAVWPILKAGYPTIGDGLIHLYRLVEFDHLLRHGVWFPRWATDLGYGYGYPLFNFYPPLAYYAGSFFHAFGLSYAHSLIAVYLLAMGLAITGTYKLARTQGGLMGGLLAAAAAAFSPYLAFNILARGALPETLALGLLPWTLWAYYRLAQKPGRAMFVLASLLYAAICLSHFLSALITLPLILVVILAGLKKPISKHQPLFPDLDWEKGVNTDRQNTDKSQSHPCFFYPCLKVFQSLSFFRKIDNFLSLLARKRLRAAAATLSSLLLAVGLSAYFLLPAVLETTHVQIQQLTAPGDLDFRNNFLSLNELLARPRPFDARLVFMPIPPSLNLITLGLAGITSLLLLLGSAGTDLTGFRKPVRSRLLRSGYRWFLLAFLLLCFFTLPISRPLWEIIPQAHIMQFPWRLVGPASLLLALLVAPLPTLLRRWLRLTNQRLWLIGLLVGAIYLFALPWTFAAASTLPTSPTVRDLPGYEATRGQLGTTSTGEFLPRTVQALPPADSLQDVYDTNPIINRLGPLPDGVTLLGQTASLTSAAATITANQATTLTFHFFHFPGWQATIDGQPTPITPSTPHGLITVSLPPGQHTVAVHFGSTPIRTTGIILSFLSLIGLSGFIVSSLFTPSRPFPSFPIRVPLIRVSPPKNQPGQSSPKTRGILTTDFADLHRLMGPFMACVGILFLVRVLILDTRPTPFAHSRFDGTIVSGVEQPLQINFANQLVLIGVDWPQAILPADSPIPVTLFWRPQNPPAADYSVSLKLLDESGNLFGQSDSQHPGRVPTSRWRLDQYAQDEHQITLLPGTPPGRYKVVVTVYQVGGAGLSVLDDNQAPAGQAYELGWLEVTRAIQPPANLDADQLLPVSGDPLTLLGLTVDNVEVAVGENLYATLFWRTEVTPPTDFTLRLELVTPEGQVLHSQTTTPARADYPTSHWQAGEIIRAPHSLLIPATVPAGPAMWQAVLISDQGETTFTLATITVHVPERSFLMPEISRPQDTLFADKIKWLGYDIQPDGLTLYWQTLALMDESYVAFVHVLDENDRILAQVDMPPLGGTRPTTSWLPGEHLTDVYTIPLDGVASIEIGFYHPQTLVRLGTARIMP
jgi:hypothetical protein